MTTPLANRPLEASGRGRSSALGTLGWAAVAVAVLLTAGCSAEVVADGSTPARNGSAAPSPEASSSAGGTSTAAAETRPHVTGYAYGEIPPVPLFTLPDLTMLDTSLGRFSATMDKAIGSVRGVSVTSSRCDASGATVANDSGLVLYGDGSGNVTGPDGSVVNYGDGSGSYSINGTDVVVYGDGSGSYNAGDTQVISYGDGSGLYKDANQSVQLYGDGSGNLTRGEVGVNNYGDGSGRYTDNTVTIVNYGDGSGNYSDGSLSIVNHGDGTGLINNQPVRLEPMAKVPALGHFPSMGSIKPVRACATTLSLRDDVLFDFDRATLRPEALPVIAKVATALTSGTISMAQVQGHTDSIGTDDYNQRLSERRAAAVVVALRAAAPGITYQAQGFGESRPVAPNEVKGTDNPAGRQLNRRVDIVIPASQGAK